MYGEDVCIESTLCSDYEKGLDVELENKESSHIWIEENGTNQSWGIKKARSSVGSWKMRPAQY